MLSAYMKDFDPFNAQKESTFIDSLPQIKAVATYLTGALSKPNVKSQAIQDLRTEFEHLLLVSLLLKLNLASMEGRCVEFSQVLSAEWPLRLPH